MASSELKIEFALKNGDAVLPEVANNKERYECPECRKEVRFRECKKKRAHFYHAADTDCLGESLVHYRAKYRVAAVANAGKLCLRLRCCECGQSYPHQSRVNGAKVEVSVKEYRVDVLCYGNDAPLLVVEVFNTHKVGDRKARDLPWSWVELAADDVMKNAVWDARDGSYQSRCASCLENKKRWDRKVAAERREKAKLLGELRSKLSRRQYASQEEYLHAGYRVGLASCQNRGRRPHRTVVFWWPGDTPPTPVPPVVSRRTRRTGEEAWESVCMSCGYYQRQDKLQFDVELPSIETGTSLDEALGQRRTRTRQVVGFAEAKNPNAAARKRTLPQKYSTSRS